MIFFSGRSSWTLASLVVMALGAARPARAGDVVVTAAEVVVRSAPFEVAPELTRLHAGDKVSADDQPSGRWRRVRLPDGRVGLVHDEDVKSSVAPAAAPVQGGAGAPPPDAIAMAQSAPPAGAKGPTLAGVMLSLLPVGTLSTRAMGPGGSTSSNDQSLATAIAAFVDVAVSPHFALGLSPQVIFHVKPEGGSGQSATQYDVRARLTARTPVSPTVLVYGRLSPAYSIIDLPDSDMPMVVAPNPKGFLLDLAVGVESAIQPKLFLVFDIGYQLGFQSTTITATTPPVTSWDTDFRTRYLHVGVGLAVRL